MARYDRIARLDAPTREEAFPGWLILRDIEDREREPELARRARLRFLALRPARRLIDRGFEEIDTGSLAQQVRRVHTALGELAEDDVERIRISGYLRAVEQLSPDGLATATIAMGEAAEAAGHGYAAEEFYHTALELSVRSELTGQRILALRSLGRLYAERAAWDRSRECLDRAAALADAEGDPVAWARVADGLATLRLLNDDPAGARAVVDSIRERGEREDDGRLAAMADAGACAVAMAAGRLESGIEDGWRAVEALDPSDECRDRVLLDLAIGFRKLGLYPAAEACYLMVAGSSASHDRRIEARVEHALAAAEAGDKAAFRERGKALLDGIEADHRLAAAVHVGLGRGAMLLDQVDDARAHLGEAIAVALAGGLGESAVMAEDLLSDLEAGAAAGAASGVRQGSMAPSPEIRTLADRIASMGRALIAYG